MNLNYRRFGQKPAVVIAHGLFGSASNWQTIGKALADQFQVFAVDLRNHGESSHDDDMSYQAMADDLLDFVDRHCEGSAALVGHSMGGKAVMAAALTAPEKIRCLGVVDIAPVIYESALGRYAELMRDLPLAQVKRRTDADALLADDIPEAAVRSFLLHNLRRDDAGNWYWRVNLDVIVRDLPQIAGWPAFSARYDGPAMFIGGLSSHYLVDEHWPPAKTLFPNAERHMLKAGHWVHAEQANQVIDLLRQLLEQGS